jgi:hypothetical protein
VILVATFSNAAFSDKDKRKDGTQGTVAEPECDYTLHDAARNMTLY